MANFISQSPTAGIQNGFNQPGNMIYPNGCNCGTYYGCGA